MNPDRYEIIQPPGGPRIVLASLPHSECAALSFYIPAGSRHEPSHQAGLAHFLEHMSFKGTSRRNARQLNIEAESAGAQINACTSEDHTVYEGRGEAEHLPLLADLLADMVWNSTLPPHELELEREVIGEEITLYRESPSDHIGDLISRALWGKHPLGNPISGTLESIAGITRQALASFRDLHHHRNDLVIAAAGPWQAAELLDTLTPLLPQTWHAPPATPPFHPSQEHPNHIREIRETDQLQLALAWHGPARSSPERHALRLLSLMLGETASSRLFLDLREERGLCYQISSDSSHFEDTGAFEISAGLDPDARAEAIDRILDTLQDFCLHGPQPGELERAKRLAITQSKFAFETTAAHAQWAGEMLLSHPTVPTAREARNRLLAVQDHDVIEAARKIFQNTPPCIAEISPP